MTKQAPHGGVVHAAGVLLMTPDEKPAEFLLMRHPKRWDLPKGHRDPGENDLQTALRELQEEIGVDPGIVRIDPEFQFETRYAVTYRRWPGETFEKCVRYFLGFIDHKPELVLTEHEDCRWWTWSPPHTIQAQTIDPLLASVADHLARSS